MGFIKKVSTRNMSKEEWLESRKAGIGGSDVSAIAGISKYKSAFNVYLEKTEITEDYDNEAMYWGRKLEKDVAEEFALRTGKKIQRCNYILQSEEYPFMLANVDRLIIGEKAGLECKTANEYANSRWTEEEIPEDYMLQIQHYMAVTGFDTWYVAVLIGGNKFRWYTIQRDEQMIASITALEENFWNNHVVAKIPPMIDGSDTASDWIKNKYPENFENEIELFGIEEDLKLWENAKRQIEFYTDSKDGAENRIKNALGNNKVGRYQDLKITWNRFDTLSFDSDRFKKEQPAMYEQYKTKPGKSQRFSIKADVKK